MKAPSVRHLDLFWLADPFTPPLGQAWQLDAIVGGHRPDELGRTSSRRATWANMVVEIPAMSIPSGLNPSVRMMSWISSYVDLTRQPAS
jgi:hypothetical protein